MGRGPDRGRASSGPRRADRAGGDDRSGQARRLLLPRRRALLDGGQHVPPRGLRRVHDERRDGRVGSPRTSAGARGWARRGSLILVAWLMLVAPAEAAPELVKAGDFTSPTYATAAPGDASRVFVTERAGRVRIIRDGVVLTTPFLDLTASTESAYQERGLLSAAFAPDYATSGRFYVYLTAKAPVGEIQIWEYRRSAGDPDVADP